ncbi:MAG: hypothetical protein KDD33_01430 [Bdellovibrionales bacterium]|nr:hypothetical protein [Bdellovibrionales bacterium]
METWVPPKKPAWKKIVFNWMFQLGVLFVVILGVVLWDNFNSQKQSKDPRWNELPTASPRPQRQRSAEPSPRQVKARAAQQPTEAQTQSFAPPPKPEAAKANGANEKETQATLEQSVRAKLFLVRRDQIEAAFANGQRVDDGVATIDKNDFKKLLKSGGRSWTSVDSMSKSFQFNKPKLLFSGERNPDTGQNLGFYFEVMVYNNNDPNSFTIELRIWNELKIGGDPTDPISLEISVPRKSYLMVSRFVAKDQGFSEEERAFFDSSSSLAALNSEAFSEDFSDLVLVLELK